MSSIVSRRPSSRNHLNEAFWMSIRLGRSRTCGRRENDLRARGEATLVVKKSGLPMDGRVLAKSGRANRRTSVTSRRDVGAQPTRIAIGGPSPQARPYGLRRDATGEL